MRIQSIHGNHILTVRFFQIIIFFNFLVSIYKSWLIATSAINTSEDSVTSFYFLFQIPVVLSEWIKKKQQTNKTKHLSQLNAIYYNHFNNMHIVPLCCMKTLSSLLLQADQWYCGSRWLPAKRSGNLMLSPCTKHLGTCAGWKINHIAIEIFLVIGDARCLNKQSCTTKINIPNNTCTWQCDDVFYSNGISKVNFTS